MPSRSSTKVLAGSRAAPCGQTSLRYASRKSCIRRVARAEPAPQLPVLLVVVAQQGPGDFEKVRARGVPADRQAQRREFEIDVAVQFLIAFSERTLISRCSHTRSPCGRSGIKKGHFTGSARALLCAVGQPGPIALSSLVHQEGSFSGSLEAQRDHRVHPRGAPGREPACRDSRRQQCARSGLGRVRSLVGTGRFELPTCRLGGGRSIHLSYVPTHKDCTVREVPKAGFSPDLCCRYRAGSASPRTRYGAPLRRLLRSRREGTPRKR